MRIQSITTGDVTGLIVTGDFDLEFADELRVVGLEALTPLIRTLRIDLAGVTFSRRRACPR